MLRLWIGIAQSMVALGNSWFLFVYFVPFVVNDYLVSGREIQLAAHVAPAVESGEA